MYCVEPAENAAIEAYNAAEAYLKEVSSRVRESIFSWLSIPKTTGLLPNDYREYKECQARANVHSLCTFEGVCDFSPAEICAISAVVIPSAVLCCDLSFAPSFISRNYRVFYGSGDKLR